MAYLHERTGIDRLTIDQGVEMGRPSRLECAIEGDRVRVGGDASSSPPARHDLSLVDICPIRDARSLQAP